MRKPIQITALRFERSRENGGPESIETEIVALCDDGTVWTLLGTDGEWIPLPRIPQVPVREDWLDEVAAYVTGQSIAPDTVLRLVEEHRRLLIEKFNSGATAHDAGDALAARLHWEIDHGKSS